MCEAGFLEIIHINLDFSGTDLANGTKDSDDVHRESARSKPIPRVLVDTAGENAQSGSSRSSVDPQPA